MKEIDHAGIVTESHYDPHTDTLTIKRTQDVEPILEMNKAAYNDNAGFKDDLVEVAYVPLIVVEQWFKEGINFFRNNPDDRKRIKEKLNSPEYRYLRTRPGRI